MAEIIREYAEAIVRKLVTEFGRELMVFGRPQRGMTITVLVPLVD